ncbi:hypothetical protein [uncultured Roseobacter sp.]|uniref:hypothetical protein n=1 Tax=uncultured Roseobacter sp. TaxID=114847 RepID=UPI002608FA4D|nr:hypothetical protein [uncultured Roseobacter sp.]
MTSKSDKKIGNKSVLAKLNSDGEKADDQPESKKGKSVLSEINEDQSEKKSDSD